MQVLTTATAILADAHTWGGPWAHGGGWWLGGLLMFLLWFAVIFLVVRLVWWRGRWGGYSTTDRAREILAERYARGELSSDEYRERLDHLR